MEILTIFTDGGARGNPGPAAIGAVVYDASGQEMSTISECIGDATNNVAEYAAVVRVLTHLVKIVDDTKAFRVTLKLDSQLVERQLNGAYKVKDANLKTYFDQVKALVTNYASVEFIHVRREENKVADKLVNEALDEM